MVMNVSKITPDIAKLSFPRRYSLGDRILSNKLTGKRAHELSVWDDAGHVVGLLVL